MYENEVYKILYEVLSPFMGLLIGRKAIELSCEKAGCSPGELVPEQFNEVAPHLKPMMRTLLGEQVSSLLLQEAKRRIGESFRR